MGVSPDMGVDGGVLADGGDASVGPDGGDASVGPFEEAMEPGEFVQVTEGRIRVTDGTGTDPNVDTFATVRAKLGAGTRSAQMNTRSYEWRLSNGVELTIWFANTNLDGDDDPPRDVDDSDEVLWIAVTGTFSGRTSRNIGLGSARTEVEAQSAYGAPPTTVDIPNPPGTLARYYTRGLLVAYGQDDLVRTMTICRAYNTEPRGSIDLEMRQLTFNAGIIRGQDGFALGTDQALVLNILGFPDGEGTVNNFRVWSYGFIGIELFFLQAGRAVLFSTVHAPYYGRILNTTESVGSPRAMLELFLGTGEPSSTPNLICYPSAANPSFGVTYSTDGTDVATTITVPLLACP